VLALQVQQLHMPWMQTGALAYHERVLQACTLAGKLSTFGTASTDEIPASVATSGTEHVSETQGTALMDGARHEEHKRGSNNRPAWLPVKCNTHALHAFYDHADNSNDVFRVAARVVAMVASALYMQPAVGPGHADDLEHSPLLLGAWQPFQAAFKAIWWEHVPMPDDLSDESAWRAELRCA
jgi:hypothetical protein